ncbi:MAG: metallophosphoesterase family protein [Defluviitaleaceae bacterium]|nr:metallophosphoesterase family protein [Defluviitaleaceae bacterium]
MRTAIISDIHGNYPALVKVLENARAERVDNYIFLGDYSLYDFPYHNEVVRELKEMENAYFIKGNKEASMKYFREENSNEIINDQNAGLYHSVRELTQKSYDFLNDLEDELYIQLSQTALVYATHISPIYERPPGVPYNKCCRNSVFYQDMLEQPFTHKEFLSCYHDFVNSDICKPYIQNINANVIVYGHNHLQSYAYCGDKLIINPGACGLPFDFNNKAAYTILEETKSGFNVIEKRVSYDIEEVINYTKSSILYEKARIICELNFMDMRSGRNHFQILDNIAREIATAKKEEGNDFSNETWAEAGERFFAIYGK